MTLAEKIKAYKKKTGQTYAHIADQACVPVENIYKWIKGVKPSDPEEFNKITNFLEGKLETKSPATAKGEPDLKDRYIERLEKIVDSLEDQVKEINSKLAALTESLQVARKSQMLQYALETEFQKFVLQNASWSNKKEDAFEIVTKNALDRVRRDQIADNHHV